MAPPSVEPRTDRAGVLAIAAVVAVIAIAAAVRMLSAWRKRRTIVREFERYWVDSLD
jgi:HAMP domain-containing protein